MIIGSGPNHFEAEFDPDKLPVISTAAIRQMDNFNWNGMDRDELSGVAAYKRMYDKITDLKPEIRMAEQNILGTNVPEQVRRHYNYVRRRYDYVVVTAIGLDSGTDTIESIRPTMESVRESCLEFGETAAFFALLNYSGDARRQQKRLQEHRAYARTMAAELLRIFPSGVDGGPDFTVAGLKKPAGHKISNLRQNELELALSGLLQHGQGRSIASGASASLYHLPIVFVDSDTTFEREALGEVVEATRTGQSMFASGRFEYVGGIMDLPLDRVTEEGSHRRMLYLTEVLRRMMFAKLPSHEFSSYLPEAFMAMKLGNLLNLGGFNTGESDNESYWLQKATEKAHGQRMDPSKYRTFGPRGVRLEAEAIAPGDPYLSIPVALKLQYMTHYTDSIIKTSIAGIEHMVNTEGAYSLTSFDQGADYAQRTMRSFVDQSAPRYCGPPLTREQEWELLDAIYAYFRSVGGQLPVAELKPFNDLVKHLLVPESKQNMIWWPPRDEDLSSKMIEPMPKDIIPSH